MDERYDALAALAVHGANVQPGQVVGVGAYLGHEELVRAIAAAAYDRGALFVDVWYFDPLVKRARVRRSRAATSCRT
jgi:aminopeptidase